MKPISNLNKERIEDIFLPGKPADIAFVSSKSHALVRSSYIIECDKNTNKIIISQPSIKIAYSFKLQQLSLTTLVKIRLDQKIRLGVSCRVVDFLSDYKLSDDRSVDAILLEYTLPIKQTDIRSSYRIQPNYRYQVNTKLIWGKDEYESGVDFNIYNVSATGIGLIASRKTEGNKKVLLDLNVKDMMDVILLLDDIQKDNRVTILMKLEIIAIDTDSQGENAFIRAKFCEIDIVDEEILHNFINDAQLYEIEQMTVK